LRPDIVVLIGDRFEILAAAQAALLARIPTAHIHGGETSENSFDESIRHAMTKMAQWHFVAAEPYRKRVVQMGEAPERVFNVGAPGLEQIGRLDWLTRAELEKDLGMSLGRPLFLVTYHPATLAEGGSAERAMKELLAAFGRFPEASIVFTYPNADTDGRIVMSLIDAFVQKYPSRARAFVSLGQRRYLSLMREADVIVGNSSSGLIEAPAVGTPTVNIGDRQKGRLRAKSVIDSAEEADAIAAAISRELSPEFRKTLTGALSVYGSGDVSGAVVAQLKRDLPRVQKPFFDIAHGH
jgi:UDP-N-acetylglucosamine 2-epimerase (non-hydrolysing)/GDP/UDP-N,N'-diacetylbacillosamine 2-epimerase (hydrolysing)